MPLTIAVSRERAPGESRVALVPETAKKFAALGAKLCAWSKAPASTATCSTPTTLTSAWSMASAKPTAAPLILRVTPPSPEEIAALPEGSVLIGLLKPFEDKARLAALNARKITAFALELLPRISRAQSMDALSSQGFLRRLPVRPDRRRPLHQVLPDADHRRRHHPPGACASHRRRRRRPAGHRHLQAPRRHGRSLRRALRRPRADRIARRQVRRYRRLCRWRRRLRPRTDRRRESGTNREAGQGRRHVGCGDHHRRHSRQESTGHHYGRHDQTHEVRRHHRRHGRRIRRQLRADPARRTRHRQRREHPRPAQSALAHADPRLRALRQEPLQLPLAVDQGRRTGF
jgi:hypothetical protein